MVEGNPFVRYRDRLDSYRRAIEAGVDDSRFVDLVRALDDAVAGVDGHGFEVTPTARRADLAAAAGLDVELWVKDETHNVGGSHKARHLFGLWLHRAVDELTGVETAGELAISSCGNAAVAAAVVARAAGRHLRVFIPDRAEGEVVDRLVALDADITRCERRSGEAGDPCFLRYREAVADGAAPFTVQGTEAPATLDGGRTIGWELAEQLATAHGGPAHLDGVYVQVGGGALAASLAAGLGDGVAAGWLDAAPRLHAVQAETVHPLVLAWRRLTGAAGPIAGGADRAGALVEQARREPERYMNPWSGEPHSVATGILDDVTYDWLPVVEAMLGSGGWPVLADEETLVRAHRLARETTGIDVCATGSAGFAGLLADPPDAGSQVAVLFTGIQRG